MTGQRMEGFCSAARAGPAVPSHRVRVGSGPPLQPPHPAICSMALVRSDAVHVLVHHKCLSLPREMGGRETHNSITLTSKALKPKTFLGPG